jgi:restriction system protein
MALWMVRAGKHGAQEVVAIEKSIVTIGWNDIDDLTRIAKRDDLSALVGRVYPEATPNAAANYVGQIWAFRSKIQKGDWVVLPLKNRAAIAVGEIRSDYEYRTDLGDAIHHTRKVKWLKTDLPRTVFDQDLLYSFGAFMTVCKIKRNDAEARVHAIVEGKPIPVAASPGAQDESEATDSRPIEVLDIESAAGDQIQQMISRKYKGHRLADLVDAVLKAQGYVTKISPPGADGGVDILAGSGPLGFDQPRICVQVKSQDSPIDVGEFRELRGVMEANHAEHGVLVSWGGFKHSVLREAASAYFKIRLWDQGEFLRQLLGHYDRISDALKAELPLKRIWALSLEED